MASLPPVTAQPPANGASSIPALPDSSSAPSNGSAVPPPNSTQQSTPPSVQSSPPSPSSQQSPPPLPTPPPISQPPPSPPPAQSSPPPPPPPPPQKDGSSPSSSPPPPPPHESQSPPASSKDGSGDSSSGSPQPPRASNTTPPPPPSRHTPPPHSSGQQLAPPGREKTPPSSQKAPSTLEGKESGGGQSQTPAPDVNIPLVVGVTAGVGVFLILLIIASLCSCNRKKKRHINEGNYYSDPSRSGSRAQKGHDYYSGGPPPAWGPPSSMDHGNMKVPPPPGWHAPPPPPMMSSSEMSSGFSGPHGPPLPPPSPAIALGFNKSTFGYDELAAATNGFSQGNLLGQGGFGYVHKGVLPNGKEIAVKSLKSGSGQGEREFQAEVEIISRVHHRHLVSLVGYCIAGGQRMLVYEFVPNDTLEYHLHGHGRPTMDFPTRLKIALGSAKGLAYLHEDCHPRIIHRDIKASNILLDLKFEAMVADFGLAKLSSDNHTHVSTRVMGTFGYLAPEYASSGKLTEKSDVFSFGVMLLELITGRRPVDSTQSMMDDSLVDWARPLLTRALTDGNYDELVDPKLGNSFNLAEMACMAACAAASVRHSAKRRPKMSQIVRALEGDSSLEDLNDGVRPGQSSLFSSSGSENDFGSYNSQMRKFQRAAMASEEFGSSEYGVTGEYGYDPSAATAGGGNNNSHEMKPHGRQRP